MKRLSVLFLSALLLVACGGAAATSPPARPTAAPAALQPTAAPASRPTAQPTAPAVARETPILTPRERVEQEYHRLWDGLSVFNPPEEMKVGVAETVTYRIAYGSDVLTPPLAEGLPTANRQVITSTVRLSRRMKASLDGDTFTITPLHSSEEKVIFPDTQNDWSWRVIPTQSGPHKLTLRLTAVIEVEPEKIPYDFPIQEQTVSVKVNWGLLVSDILKNSLTQFAAACATLSTIVGAIYRFVIKRRQTVRAPADAPAAQSEKPSKNS